MESGYPLKQTRNVQKQSSAEQEHPIWHLWKFPCRRRARRKCETKQTRLWRGENWESWAWRNNRWTDRFLSPADGIEHWQQLPIFMPLTEETSCTVKKSWHVTWQRQQQQTGRRWWDWGGIWKTDPGFSCGTNFKKRRANLKRSQTQIGQVAEEHAAVQQEDTQLQDLISSKCDAKHKLLWLSVQRKPNCEAWWERRPKRWDSYRCTKTSAHTHTHMNELVLGDASAALAIVARRGLGKLRHMDTNYFWIQEKAAKGDVNFKKVAGVDNGADLFTKTLSWNEMKSHIRKLGSQLVQNEFSVNYVGARPNGVKIFLKYCKNWVLPAAETWQRGLERTWALEQDAQLLKADLNGVMWLLVSPQMLSTERSSIHSWHET